MPQNDQGPRIPNVCTCHYETAPIFAHKFDMVTGMYVDRDPRCAIHTFRQQPKERENDSSSH